MGREYLYGISLKAEGVVFNRLVLSSTAQVRNVRRIFDNVEEFIVVKLFGMIYIESFVRGSNIVNFDPICINLWDSDSKDKIIDGKWI